MALVAACVLGAGIVSAGATSDAGAGQSLARLTQGERNAMKIASVRASVEEGAGLLVTATFAGNIQKAIGRGNLRRAVVALLLHPSDPRRRVMGVATRRGGSVGETITNAGANRVAVARNGRKLNFLIRDKGLAFSEFTTLEVKAFARFPTGSARGAGVTADYWEAIDREIARDEEAIRSPETRRTCSSLLGLEEDIQALLKRAKERQTRLEKARRQFEKAIPELEDLLRLGQYARAGNIILALTSGALAPFAILFQATPAAPFAATTLGIYAFTLKNSVDLRERNQALRDAIRGLKLDVRLADAYIEKNRELIERLRQVEGQIQALKRIYCEPPRLTPIHAEFNQATFSTVYTENATGQDLTYIWGVSIPADPQCANGFQPRTPQPNQATWNHADTTEGGSCSHAAYDPNSGHPGTVRVLVENRSWSCVATYFGTFGPNGTAVGDGPPPERCELRPD